MRTHEQGGAVTDPVRGALRRIAIALSAFAAIATLAMPALARLQPGEVEYEDLKKFEAEMQARGVRIGQTTSPRGPALPAAIPDIFGPGAVLNVGNVFMKVTNNGIDGNPFTAVSSDPSCQWPGASSTEYMNFIGLGVGAVNPLATDPTALRRVSLFQEWRPATLEAEDRIYRAYDGIVNGSRFINEDGDSETRFGFPMFDEDFLDGRDNDGDGSIDEDYGAIGQQMFSMTIRDDTPQAIAAGGAERHVPLGVEAQKTAWAYSIPGFTNFNIIHHKFINRSGHVLDSLVVGFRVDMDCGPTEIGTYFSDDFDINVFPQGDFLIETRGTDLRLQPPGDRDVRVTDIDPDSALCPRYPVRVQGFSVADDEGDDGRTPGIAHFLLIDHTIDPLGENGPRSVGWRAFRSWVGGTPYTQGGNPTIDQQRFEFMTSTQNIDPETGFINAPAGDQKGDFTAFASVGPWLNVPDGGTIEVTVAMGVAPGTYRGSLNYLGDYLAAKDGDFVTQGASLLSAYPVLDNALSAQVAFEGAYEVKDWPLLPPFHGQETPIVAPPGQFITAQGCETRDLSPRLVTDAAYQWFDFDCNYCTGAYSPSRGGFFHRTWLAEAPPPSPNTNVSSSFNYSDNPSRSPDLIAAGNAQINLAWDNASELVPDPKTGQFDFRGYRIWKVSNWQRPVGAGGPAEDDWTLVGEYRYFNHRARNYTVNPDGSKNCPLVYIPQLEAAVPICLDSLDLWDSQSGQILKPDSTVQCTGWPNCETAQGDVLGRPGVRETRAKYPVGRYRYTDRQVKNGFLYFYSITALDSSGVGNSMSELGGRRSAVEAEAVVPQTSAVDQAGGVWVVPNPYRGSPLISDRPSSWDLLPNATDPTGTHIDFFGLPRGQWTIKIFTVSGDLTAELRSTDGVNESVRGPVTGDDGNIRDGYTRQQDNPDDGQARWNLISRNGQDVVSGIYLFTVESTKGTQRGRFVIIR